MNIRLKILVYFSILTISLLGTAFILIYTLFSNYRLEQFQQRIKDRTITDLKFITEVQQIDNELLATIDRHTINNLYREKIMIFDSNKQLIYSSIDDTEIKAPGTILNLLSPDEPLLEFEEDGYDVVGMVFEYQNQNYYGVAKAYDKFGHFKIEYLKYILLTIFAVISSVVLVTSVILSKQISQPINQMGIELERINLENSDNYITVPEGNNEINLLATRFNELMKKLDNAFLFQKHAIHHISHELKTPISILVSNFERMEKETDIEKIMVGLRNQKEDTKNLSDIINALLELSKVESGNKVDVLEIRIDEIIFDIIHELRAIRKDFRFTVEIDDSIENEQGLIVLGNRRLLHTALMNLATNCLKYSNNDKSRIKIYNSASQLLSLDFINNGEIILADEEQFLFQHFFRGVNSKGKRGFGLGLVLINKIITLHNGTIFYHQLGNSENVFQINLPLAES